MFARLGELALLSEHIAPVGVDFGGVRLDLQGLPVVLDRLGVLTLISERQAPVVVSFRRVRLEVQGLLVMLDRLGQLALLSERSSITSRPCTSSLTLRRSEEHTSELQSQSNLVCRLLLEKKKPDNQDPGAGH